MVSSLGSVGLEFYINVYCHQGKLGIVVKEPRFKKCGGNKSGKYI
jgi:hypothetical protein